ncbi:MAG: archease [Actinomycetota bacterium]|nr:archease [Actinomycetota bacterium]
MGSFEILEHTADVGIRARGKSLEELFEQASRGLAEIIGIWRPASTSERKGQVHAEQTLIDLDARDLGGLLVDWLGEIVYLADVKEGFLTQVEAEAVREPGDAAAGGCSAAGRLWLEPRVGEQPEGTAVKAITYHRLKVAPTPTGWMAEVYVDV